MSQKQTPKWLNEESSQILNRGYLLKNETIEDAIERVVTSAATKYKDTPIYNECLQWFDKLIRNGWLSWSSPIWANMGTERGLPISCFNVHINDSMEGIATKVSEVMMQTKIGGGTSAYFGDLRPRGAEIVDNGTSSGAVSFMKLFDTVMDVVSQGSTRRGAFAAYIDIDHGDIEEFLQIKDIGSPIQNLFYGVCVADEWMQSMIDGNEQKRDIWAKVLQSRQQKGLPYILFTDNVNNNKPEIYKDLDLKINASNLCSEIALPSSHDESFICCLSSMNLELYDEWKDTDAVKYAIYFLDAVMSEFIDKTNQHKLLDATRKFAIRHRAVGLGVLGYHSYLQQNLIAFESMKAKMWNARVFQQIQNQSLQASLELAQMLGAAPIFNEVQNDKPKYRNATVCAIAPTTSSSAILGQVSPGIEPYASNYYKAGLAKGNFIRKNKHLTRILQAKGLDTDEIWDSIMRNEGSIQHLTMLSDLDREVFKTFREISPIEIVIQAAQRQQYIDQSQSLNINIPSDIPIKEVNGLIIEAWRSKVKTLYYQRSESASKQAVLNMVNCSSCEA